MERPWVGGIWEALIKSNSFVYQRNEMLASFMCEVEPMLSQRPFTYVSDDVNEYEYLITNRN